jgi:apolipoprotein N-acyltransferase
VKDFQKQFGVITAIGGGAALGLAPQTGLWWLAWFALAPLWVSLSTTEKPKAFRLGMLFGMVYHGIMLRWLLGMHPLTWMGIPWWPSLGIAIGLWLLVSATQAWVIGAWAWLVFRHKISGLPRITYAIGIWIALHWLWGQGSTAFPWDDISQTQSGDLWGIQIVSLGGSALLTALLVAVNGFVAEYWLAKNKSFAFASLAILISTHSYGIWQLGQPLESAGASFRIGVVQGNIPQNKKWSPSGFSEALRTYVKGYTSLSSQGVDAVLVPETAYPRIWMHTPDPNNPLVQAIRKQKKVLILGAFDVPNSDALNTSLFALDASSGAVAGSYNKEHLVPLGEQIPLKEYIGWLIRKLSPLKGELEPGILEQRFTTPFGVLAGGICFDSAFGEGFRWQVDQGGTVLVTATNDAWFGPAMAPEHHALDTLRAVETARWLVRASNNGTSGSIDPRGRTEQLTGWNVYAEFIQAVQPLKTRTLYVQWGDWVPPLSAGLAIFSAIASRRVRRP